MLHSSQEPKETKSEAGMVEILKYVAENPQFELLLRYDNRIYRDCQALRFLKGKHVTLVIGQTGAGKSTLVNAIISGPDSIDEDDDGNYTTTVPLMFDGIQMFKIGDSAMSVTETPGFYPVSDGSNIYIADCPGFGDSNTSKEFPNQTAVRFISKHAESVAVCFVLKGADMETARGHLLLQLCTQVNRLLTTKVIDEGSFQLLILINQAHTFKTPKLLQKSFKQTIDVLQDKMEASKLNHDELSDEQQALLESFTGPNYPTDEEYERVKKLAEYFLENYKVVEPKDDVNAKHASKEVSMKELKQVILDQTYQMKREYIETDMLKKYSYGIEADILRDASKASGFRADPRVRAEFKAAVERLCESWSGPNTDSVLRQLTKEINLAETAEKSALLKWFNNTVSSSLKAGFKESKLTSFHYYNGPSTYTVDTHPIYPLFRMLFYKEWFHNEEHEMTLKVFKAILTWFKENSDNGVLGLQSFSPAPNDHPFKGTTYKACVEFLYEEFVTNDKLNGADEDLVNGWMTAMKNAYFGWLKEGYPPIYDYRFSWGWLNLCFFRI